MNEMTTAASSMLDLKSTCLIIIVVGAATGANLWLHRSDLPLGQVRYSNYGFSFVHPKNLPTYSWGYSSASEANDFEGIVQAKGLREGVWQNFMIIWFTDVTSPDLEAELDDFYDLMNSWDCEIDNKGELHYSEKDGHKTLLQTYTFIEDGDMEYIAASAVWFQHWPSLRANRVYLLTYIAYPHLTTREQTLETLEQFIDAFNGNTAQTG
jgi:hypothetical protein